MTYLTFSHSMWRCDWLSRSTLYYLTTCAISMPWSHCKDTVQRRAVPWSWHRHLKCYLRLMITLIMDHACSREMIHLVASVCPSICLSAQLGSWYICCAPLQWYGATLWTIDLCVYHRAQVGSNFFRSFIPRTFPHSMAGWWIFHDVLHCHDGKADC